MSIQVPYYDQVVIRKTVDKNNKHFSIAGLDRVLNNSIIS